MSYKFRAIIWPIFLFACYWSCQIIEAEKILPQHIKEATTCLRDYIGEAFVPKSFQGPSLLYGEYLQEFCSEEDMDLINKKVVEDTQGHGEEVRECLRNLGLEKIYEKFFKSGADQIDIAIKKEQIRESMGTNHSGVPLLQSFNDYSNEIDTDDVDDLKTSSIDVGKTNNIQKPLPENSQIFETPLSGKPTNTQISTPEWEPDWDILPVREASSTLVKSEAQQVSQESVSKDQKQPVVQADMTSKQDQSKNLPREKRTLLSEIKFADLTKFSFGLCFNVPTFNFEQLKDHEEKTVTFNCLKQCETSFFNKIKTIIFDGRKEVLNFMKERYNELLNKQNQKDAKNKQSNEIEITAATNMEKPAEKVSDTNESPTFGNKNKIIFPLKKRRKPNPIDFRKTIDDFETKTDFKEEKDAFEQALIANVAAKMEQKQKESKKSVPALQFKDIEMLTTTGIKFLDQYSQFFADVYEFLKNDVGPDVSLPLALGDQNQLINNDDETEVKKETIESRLHTSFFLYTGCARKQCHMRSNESIPMHVYIQSQAKDSDEDLLIPSETDVVIEDNDDDSDNDTDVFSNTETVIAKGGIKPQQATAKQLTPMQKFAKLLTNRDFDDLDSSSESESDEY